MSLLMEAILWKFPGLQGVDLDNDIIVKFPGGIPSQQEQGAWIDEYEVNGLPFIEWQHEMSIHDTNGITRDVESIIDSMDGSQLSRLDQFTKDKHTAKKEARSRKPT